MVLGAGILPVLVGRRAQLSRPTDVDLDRLELRLHRDGRAVRAVLVVLALSVLVVLTLSVLVAPSLESLAESSVVVAVLVVLLPIVARGRDLVTVEVVDEGAQGRRRTREALRRRDEQGRGFDDVQCD